MAYGLIGKSSVAFVGTQSEKINLFAVILEWIQTDSFALEGHDGPRLTQGKERFRGFWAEVLPFTGVASAGRVPPGFHV